MMRWPPVQVARSGCRRIVVLAYLLLGCGSVSARSNNNYNVYKYDETVPQFTPDGRLLQVEYASAAADHSTPVVAAAISDDLVLLCTTTTRRRCTQQQQQQQQPTTTTTSSTTTTCTDDIYQERLVLVPTGTMARTTAASVRQKEEEHVVVVVALSGILADSLALLEAVQEERFSQQRTYGESGSDVPARVARTIADKCQKHAFGGGKRPFGATLLVCGASSSSLLTTTRNRDYSSISFYRTDPSGSILDISLDATSDRRFLIVGGSGTARSLKQQLSSYFSSSKKAKIGDILSIVLDEQTKLERGGDKQQTALSLEAVLVSKQKGVLKLSEEQIDSFLQKKRL